MQDDAGAEPRQPSALTRLVHLNISANGINSDDGSAASGVMLTALTHLDLSDNTLAGGAGSAVPLAALKHSCAL
jgi:hypothetical protein